MFILTDFSVVETHGHGTKISHEVKITPLAV
jgi:hypothetical protein